MSDDPRDARRPALVYNPTKVERKRLRKRVEKAAKDAGWRRPLFYETTPEDLGQDVTARALREGVDAILVAGGDGTVRAVAEALIESRVPLTILPSGTGNLLARNLNLPLMDQERIIRATFDGRTEAVDIGMATLSRADGTTEEHAFVVMAGIGLDAAMIANTSPQLKKTMGWIAYIDGAARALGGAQPFRIVYQRNGGRLHSTKAHSMLFANCGTLPAGIALMPEASLTDGILDIALIQPAGPFGWLAVWRKVWWDNSVLRRTRSGRRIVSRTRNSSVRYLSGTEIEAAVDDAHPVQLDGDEFGEAVRIRVRVLAGSLLVALPHR